VLDQIEERLLTPLDVVEQADERRLLREQLAERQAISSAEVTSSASRKRERIEAAAAGSEGSACSCLITSTTGQ
jgi:hypothetical protein